MTVTGAPVIRPAHRDEISTLAGVLARAFDQYTWTRWSVPAEGYSRRLVELQDLYLRYALGEGTVLAESALGGVVALLPPAAPAPSYQMQVRVAELHGDRLADVASADLPTVPEGWWTLETLGVLPERQGAGLGGALIRAGLDAVSGRGGEGVALETSDLRNVSLYERAGFTVRATTRVDQGPTVYSMGHGGGATPLSRRQRSRPVDAHARVTDAAVAAVGWPAIAALRQEMSFRFGLVAVDSDSTVAGYEAFASRAGMPNICTASPCAKLWSGTSGISTVTGAAVDPHVPRFLHAPSTCARITQPPAICGTCVAIISSAFSVVQEGSTSNLRERELSPMWISKRSNSRRMPRVCRLVSSRWARANGSAHWRGCHASVICTHLVRLSLERLQPAAGRSEGAVPS